MRGAVLVDAGPLVALLRADDNAHRSCLATARTLPPPLFTTWAPVTEALYLLDTNRAQDALLDMLQRDAIRIISIGEPGDIQAIRDLMHKFRDLPMDFADATLVRVAQREGISRIFTLDRRDFSVYRGARGRPFTIVP